MSGDEVLVTIASVVLGPLAWAWWLWRAVSIDGLRTHRPPVALLGAGVGLAGVFIFAILRFGAAVDVREAPDYLFMYFVLGLAWIRVIAFLFPLVGLNPRDDLIERRNAAAIPAWTGAILAVTCCYAGGNIGNGPGWWVVVFAAGLATAALGGVWILAGQWTGIVESVTVDRDPAAGWRLGGLLAACGAIFGAAVMGDWVSAQATVADFVTRGWIAVPIVIIAMQLERVLRPRPERPRADVISGGIVPALLYVVAAGVGIKLIGWPAL